MKVKFNGKMLGLENRVNKKGEPYTLVGIIDGIELVNLMLDKSQAWNIDHLKDKEVEVICNYNARFGSIGAVEKITLINNK